VKRGARNNCYAEHGKEAISAEGKQDETIGRLFEMKLVNQCAAVSEDGVEGREE